MSVCFMPYLTHLSLCFQLKHDFIGVFQNEDSNCIYFTLLQLVFCAFQYHEHLNKFWSLNLFHIHFAGKKPGFFWLALYTLSENPLTSSFLLSPTDRAALHGSFILKVESMWKERLLIVKELAFNFMWRKWWRKVHGVFLLWKKWWRNRVCSLWKPLIKYQPIFNRKMIIFFIWTICYSR